MKDIYVRWTSKNYVCFSCIFSDTDDCNPYPCVNNATCIDDLNNYTCTCPPGFEGKNCSISKFSFPVHLFLIGQWFFFFIGLDMSLICFSARPVKVFFRFLSDKDDCDPYPCVNNGTCTDNVNNYTCACHLGFEGRNCTISKFLIL